MRIVAVADTHLFEADLGVLPEGDVLVHAGDMLRRGSFEELERFAAWLSRQPHRHVVVVAGNHDVCFEQDRARAVATLGPRVHYLQDCSVTIDRVTFWGSPWQPRYHDWSFNLDRGEALRRKWAAIPADTQVLVTHGPPAGFGDRSPVAGRAGCEDLAARVRELGPALHLFGHIHQDGGLWEDGPTTYANVTTWECERGATVVDLLDRVVPVQVPPSGG